MKNIIAKFVLAVLLVSTISCTFNNDSKDNNIKEIIVLYTNDEHGWLEPTDEFDGAPGLYASWKNNEAYDGSDKFLILSGGDMWTGPAISTWFKGKPMIEAMNAMGYDVATIGNHEFDFKVDYLTQQISENINFPLISANIIDKNTGEIPSFAKPYVIIKANGVKVGIIGLASLSTPYTTFPANVADYQFTSYADAVEKYSAIAKNNGAEVLFIIGHICEDEMEELVPVAKKCGVCLIGGGHCHKKVLRMLDGVLLIESGSKMENYVKVNLHYNKNDKNVTIDNYNIIENKNGDLDTSIQSIVNYWKDKVDDVLSDKIGYCNKIIYESSTEMKNMLCDSWLHTFPNADVSITNAGGIRQDIIAGDISLETIVSLLPFENSIYELNLTGAELLNCITNLEVGGMTTINGNYLSDGRQIYSDSTYTVLTIDYLYSRDDNNFALYDSVPYNTSVNYRQPLIDWMISKNTSSQDPINNYLDYTPRK